MYNYSMKLRKLKLFIHKFFLWKKTIPTASLLLFAVFVLVLFFITQGMRQKKQVAQQPKGIVFETFWEILQTESKNFLNGSDLYIAGIEVVNSGQFVRRAGRSAIWQAKIVRCEQFFTQPTEEDQNKLSCAGQSALASIADPEATNLSGNLTIQADEIPFLGTVVKASDIVIGPSVAEDTANKHVNYSVTKTDDYYYKLVINPTTLRPLWQIAKQCSIQARQEKTCDSSEDWVVLVDATSGQTL